MAKVVLTDELIATAARPAGLPEGEYRRARRALVARRFLARMRRAVRSAVHGCPGLARARVTVSR